MLEYHSVSTLPDIIRSRSNKLYQKLLHTAGGFDDPNCPWVLVEGWKQIMDLSQNSQIEVLLFSSENSDRLSSLKRRSRRSVHLSDSLLKNISNVKTSQGVAAFFQKRRWEWKDLTDYVLYAYEIQDPGNLGTLLRTAESTGLFTLVTSTGSVSCYNSKTVRASVGAALRLPILENVSWELLKLKGYEVWASTPFKGTSLFQANFTPPVALMIGNEGSGLPCKIMEQTDHLLHIPMGHNLGSLNAAVAGSLILYEVLRRKVGDA